MSTLKVTNIEPQSGTDVHITGSLIVSNIVRAREVVTTISSSQILVSGSTRFGDTSDDTHLFTGSLNVSNGITGSTEFSTIVNKPTLLSSSAQIATDISGSSTALSSSVAGRLTTEENNVDVLQSHVGNIHAYTASSDSEITALMASTGSQYAHVSGLLAATGSNYSHISNINASTGSNYAHISNLNASTGSVYSHVTGLLSATSSYGLDSEVTALMGATSSYALSANVVANSSTASFASTGSNTFTENQIVSASVLLTLQQLTGSMPTGIATGSLIVSGSPVQLYIYNGSGSGWNRV